ncbi:MAG TPA: tectonin domain-containing protein [Longimicrobium sp.]
MSIADPQVAVSGITVFGADPAAVPWSGGKQVPGVFTQVSAGSRNQVWGVTAPGDIYHFQNGEWVQVPGGLSCVSAAADGTVWGVNSSGFIYRRDGSSWTKIPGGLSQISVGSATQVWGVNSIGNIYQWTGTDWLQVPGGLSCVSAAADGTVWGVNSSGSIYRRDGSNWTHIPGVLSQISVGSATRVWGVNSAGIYQWTGTDWLQVPGALSNVSVASDGTVWGANSAGSLYYYMQAAPLVVSNPRLGEADLEQDETARYLFDVSNTAPGTVLQNVRLGLLYDKAAFTRSGVTVTPDTLDLPVPLAYGQTVTLNAVVLTASATARLGTYGFSGVSASYQVALTSAASVPVSSPSGGWMTFTVVAP